MVRPLYLVLLLAGCDRVLQLIEVSDAGTSDAPIGAADAAAPMACPAA